VEELSSELGILHGIMSLKQCMQLHKHFVRSHVHIWHVHAGAQFTAEAIEDKMGRYSFVMDTLSKQLDTEKRACRNVKAELARVLDQRSELQSLLLGSIEAAKSERQ
jgi:hypothetical protein